MKCWVVVVVPDGPMNLQVIGDSHGEPFTDLTEAERAAHAYRHHGGGYSVYVQEVHPS